MLGPIMQGRLTHRGPVKLIRQGVQLQQHRILKTIMHNLWRTDQMLLLRDKTEHNWEAEMECFSNKPPEQLTKYWIKIQTKANPQVVCIHQWVSTTTTYSELWTVLLRTKRDFHQVRVWVQTWDRITGQEVKIEYNLYAVEAFPSVTMTSLLTKLLTSLKEATFTTLKVSRISETVTQIQFRGETAFKDKLVLETAVYLLKMDKMHLNKVKSRKN